MHIGRGHTAGDMIAYVPDANVVFSGDLVEYQSACYCGDAHFTDWPATLDRLAAFQAKRAGARPRRRRWPARRTVDRRHRADTPISCSTLTARSRTSVAERPLAEGGVRRRAPSHGPEIRVASRSTSIACHSTWRAPMTRRSGIDRPRDLDGRARPRDVGGAAGLSVELTTGSAPAASAAQRGLQFRISALARSRTRGAGALSGRHGRRRSGRPDAGDRSRAARRAVGAARRCRSHRRAARAASAGPSARWKSSTGSASASAGRRRASPGRSARSISATESLLFRSVAGGRPQDAGLHQSAAILSREGAGRARRSSRRPIDLRWQQPRDGGRARNDGAALTVETPDGPYRLDRRLGDRLPTAHAPPCANCSGSNLPAAPSRTSS